MTAQARNRRQRQSEIDARNAVRSESYYQESAQRIEIKASRRPATPCVECRHFDPAIGCDNPLQRSVDGGLAFWVYGMNEDGSTGEGTSSGVSAKGRIPTAEGCHHFEGEKETGP